MSVVLLISATLLMRSFLQLQKADPGFDDHAILSMRVVLSGDQYDDVVARAEYFDSVTARLSANPGIVAAAATGAIPADDGGSPIRVLPEGAGITDEGYFATAVPSTEGLFRTLGLELLAGRTFTAAETRDPEATVVIAGQTLARRLWPGGDALGRSVRVDGTRNYRIIGIAPDLQYEEFGEDSEGARMLLHVPYAVGGWRRMALLVQSSSQPDALITPVRAELRRIDATQAPYDILTMPERRKATTWEQGLFGNSFAAFGLMALVLALCGVYGVIAYSVARRTQEIGVRIAMEARPHDVLTQVVARAVRLALVGVLAGLGGAALFARGMTGVLYGISATEPRVFGAVALLLLAAATAAYLPARRAAGVDPTRALRME